jgi:cytochrome P450
MEALAQRNILETLLGPAADGSLDRLAAASRNRKRAFERHFVSLFPVPQLLPSQANRDYLRATRLLRAAVDEEIAARRSAGRRPDDMLSLLMETTFDDGTAMSDREVREEVMMLTLTGYDSVNEALQWTLCLLAQHPEADAALAAEALAGAQTAYATSAIRESLRLFPPTWMVVRCALGEDRLPSGATIPAGAKAYLCPYVVQRNPAYWPEPDRFLPARFADGAANGRPRYAYFPFGGGPHVCIGEMLAMAQIVAVLRTLARRWQLSLPDGVVVVPDGGLTLRPRGGLRMRAELRESAPL